MALSSLPPERRDAVAELSSDLRRVFAARLRLLVAYGLNHNGDEPLHTMALVDRVTFDDLAACAPAVHKWQRLGLAVPLVISRDEFLRTLDVFPVEYDSILGDHVVIEGGGALDSIQVPESDLRREIERHAKSHLIHLREGFLESRREPRFVAALIAESAPAFRALLLHIARLNGITPASPGEIASAAERTVGIDPVLVRDVLAAPLAAPAIADPAALFERYVDAAERIWQYVDRWRVWP